MRTQNRWLIAGIALAVAAVGIGPAIAYDYWASIRRGPGAERAGGDTCRAAALLLFCEDFEDLRTGEPTGAKWRTDLVDGRLTVEKQAAAGSIEWLGGNIGNQVLRAQGDRNGRAWLVVDGFAAPGNSFFGRIRVLLHTLPAEPDLTRYVFVQLNGDQPRGEIIHPLGGQLSSTGGGGDRNRMAIGARGGPTGGWTSRLDTGTVETERWYCLEWQMDAVDNRITVWIDGVAQPQLAVSTKQHGGEPVDFVFPTFTQVRIGWQLFQRDPTPVSYDTLIDDVALGIGRVGC